ncbi:unnamed protein product [Schistosoma margrebowiei]|uniref:Uncharacterized protein n=1 Tax=Schistosoma margrebowiei TaxID=48269 RepID=A0A183NC11_9TREM|nr:unnamed protein product [Schistosoma margrebowiei]
MVVGGSQQEFRATWHSPIRCTYNLEGTGTP